MSDGDQIELKHSDQLVTTYTVGENADTKLPERLYPQRLKKRVRVRRCIAKLRIPADPVPGSKKYAEVVLQCELQKDHDGQHVHSGIIECVNGTARDYKIGWTDLGYRSVRKTS